MAAKKRQVPSTDVLNGPTASVPLRGYVVDQDKERLWIQDREGTWSVARADIVATQEWNGNDPRFHGKPTCVFVRDGAEILEIKTYRVQATGVPITLGAIGEQPTIRGEEAMRMLERRTFRHLGLFNDVDPGPLVLIGTTVCCYGDPSGFGLICAGDDSGPVI